MKVKDEKSHERNKRNKPKKQFLNLLLPRSIDFLCISFRAKTYAAPVSCENNRKIIESEVLLFNQNVALKYKDGQKYNYRISLL